MRKLIITIIYLLYSFDIHAINNIEIAGIDYDNSVICYRFPGDHQAISCVKLDSNPVMLKNKLNSVKQ